MKCLPYDEMAIRDVEIADRIDNGEKVEILITDYQITRNSIYLAYLRARGYRYSHRPLTNKQVIYKGLREWMNANHYSILDVNRMLVVPYSQTTSLKLVFEGYRNLDDFLIREIIRISGLTYERLFWEVDG